MNVFTPFFIGSEIIRFNLFGKEAWKYGIKYGIMFLSFLPLLDERVEDRQEWGERGDDTVEP